MTADARRDAGQDPMPGAGPEGRTTAALGFFTALEALRWRPHDTLRVLVHGRLRRDRRAELEREAAAAGVPCARDDAAVERRRRKGNVYALAEVQVRDDALDPSADHVVLLRPSHFGNVGSALRSMVAFGVRDLALVGGEVDAWSPHVLRASVGLRLAARCRAYPTVAAYAAEHPGRTPYVFTAAAERELRDVVFEAPATLVFGPEWPRPDEGLPRGRTVSIWQDGGVESLNLAVAVSIATYQLGRRRGSAGS